ncbi:hypothetical protein BGZ58_004556, partial [Dissophora ornata]
MEGGMTSSGPKPIMSKIDRLKDQERLSSQQRVSTAPSSILSQPTESKEDLFPAAAPRPALNQPRSRTSTRIDNHHLLLSLDTQLPSSPSSSPSQDDNNSKATTTVPALLSQRRKSTDSAKVFADAKWTVEKAYGGNIGLQNAVNSIEDQLSKLIWIGTLGMATDALTDRTRGDIRAELAVNHSSIPVFVNDQDFEGHYHQFCKQ